MEAYPEPIRYWERADGRHVEGHDRGAQPDLIGGGAPYRSIMRLRLMKLASSDFGSYHCVAKNELGLTKGVFKIHGNWFNLFWLKTNNTFHTNLCFQSKILHWAHHHL